MEMGKVKKNKYETEEQKEIKKFIIVLVGLILVIVGIYFFTRAFVTKDLFKNTDDIQYKEGAINYEVAIVGNMLSRPEKEYYVFAFNSESNKINHYNTLASKYKGEKDALKMYYLDTNNELNKKYVATDESISTSFKSLEELKLGEVTLIKVKNGKVTKLITNVDDIKKELNI